MNPDQTPTPETDAAWKWDTLTGEGLKRAREKSETLERQRDTARAEATEAKEVVASLLQNSDSLRAEVERLTKERDHSQPRKEGDESCPAPAPTTMTPAIPIAHSIGTSNAAPGYVPSVPVAATPTITFDLTNLRSIIERASPEESNTLVIPFLKDSWLALIDAAQERDSLRAELATLRATRDELSTKYLQSIQPKLEDFEQERVGDADHGAAIVAADTEIQRWYHDAGYTPPAETLQALVALVANSQQKGGEEPCATPTLSEASKHCASSAAPTSDPEGAATQDQIGILSRDNHRMRKFGTLLAEAALYVIREYDGTHRLSLAVSAWAKAIGDEGGRGLLDTTPSPTHEKLACEIDDLYEAPSRIRPLRRILAREFGASHSMAEAEDISEAAPCPSVLAVDIESPLTMFANEIEKIYDMEGISTLEEREGIESILSRFREHELLALKAVLEQRTAEANLAVAVGENLQTQLESSRAELRELREECERLRNTLTTVKELLPTRERALFRDGNSSTPIGVHTISEAKVIRIRAAIDAAMQPSEETKP